MGLFNRNKKTDKNIEERADHKPLGLLFNGLSSYSESKAMKLAAFYCGVNQISNSVAMLPKNIVFHDLDETVPVNHQLFTVLNLKPNSRYTPYNLWKQAIEHIILKGNAYFLIERDKRLNVVAIHPIENQFITVLPQADGSIKYSIAGIGTVDSCDILDFAMHYDEMHNGISLLKYASQTLSSAENAEESSDNFYKGGAGLSGILKASQTLTKEQKEQIRESWQQAFTSSSARGIAVLPQGLDFQAVSVDAKDAQLLESRSFNVIEIARFLNISPIRLFDLSEVSYSSMEATNLSYLEDSVRPYCEMIANEINLKLFKPSEVGKYAVAFDYANALQTNRQALGEYYRMMITNGILSLNEVRKELGYPKLKEDYGNEHYLQISYGSAKNIAEGQYIKQSQESQTQSTQQDNKVKNNTEENKK